jgi:hypothetical protein
MNPTTRLKWGTAVFIVIWIAGMLCWSGSLAPANLIATAICGLIVGYAWYRAMRWQLARGALPRSERSDAPTKR